MQLCSSSFISAGLQHVCTGYILSAANVIFGTNCLSSTHKLYFCWLFALSCILFCCFLIILGNGITLSSNALYCLDVNMGKFVSCPQRPSILQAAQNAWCYIWIRQPVPTASWLGIVWNGFTEAKTFSAFHFSPLGLVLGLLGNPLLMLLAEEQRAYCAHHYCF